MKFVQFIFIIFFICGLFAEKLPAVCVTKIVNGKLVRVGDCEVNDASEILSLIRKSVDKKTPVQNKCDVTYKSKCYRIVRYSKNNVTFNNAESICKSRNNGKLANIYDLTQYQLLLPYLRPKAATGWAWYSVWTGMKYKNNQLLEASNQPSSLPKEVWHPNYPLSDGNNANVAVAVYKDSKGLIEGMHNLTPVTPIHGAICEL
ncbi:uncharacterized protein LOC144422949 [Styela clava]